MNAGGNDQNGRRAFDLMLASALAGTKDVRESVTALSLASVAGTPEAIYAATMSVEGSLERSRIAVARVGDVLRRFGVNSLEDARLAMLARGRRATASDLAALSREYTYIKDILRTAEDTIDGQLMTLATSVRQVQHPRDQKRTGILLGTA